MQMSWLTTNLPLTPLMQAPNELPVPPSPAHYGWSFIFVVVFIFGAYLTLGVAYNVSARSPSQSVNIVNIVFHKVTLTTTSNVHTHTVRAKMPSATPLCHHAIAPTTQLAHLDSAWPAHAYLISNSCDHHRTATSAWPATAIAAAAATAIKTTAAAATA